MTIIHLHVALVEDSTNVHRLKSVAQWSMLHIVREGINITTPLNNILHTIEETDSQNE